jgi:NAD(P)-dependent dehydrogenase (short-subunit alcohol dehydrogenase family)
MKQNTMNKVWFITGAGSGLGAGIARAALRAGDRVVATGRNLEKVRKAFPDIASENIAYVPLDVADEAQAKVAVDEAMKRFGRIDVLVNNAGYSLLGNFEQMTAAEIQQQFAPNFYGVVHVMQAALPVMRRQRSGHIINISSVAGVVGLKHCAAYAATKFAVEGLSLSVATEVARFGIKVTVVESGFFRTDLLDAHNVRWVSKVVEDYAPEGTAEDMWSKYNGTQPNDPAKLGDALVKIAAMQNPPKVFAAGSDALSTITPAIEERLRDMRAHEILSNGMEGSF